MSYGNEPLAAGSAAEIDRLLVVAIVAFLAIIAAMGYVPIAALFVEFSLVVGLLCCRRRICGRSTGEAVCPAGAVQTLVR